MYQFAAFAVCLAIISPAYSQQAESAAASTTGVAPTVAPLNHRRLSPENAYARAYAVVPMIGTGTKADPKRPMFVPAPLAETAAVDRTGIIAYQFQISDDGKSALVEFVAVSRSGLAPILTSATPGVISFERGQHTREKIETAFQRYKKSFTFSKFMPVRAQ